MPPALPEVHDYGLVIKPTGHPGKNVGKSTYYFASRERNSNLDEPKGENKAPLLTISSESRHKPISSLTNGHIMIKDWEKAHEAFDFQLGKVVSKEGGGDFFIADRGNNAIIHVFDSPGIIDMGAIPLDDIKEAPTSGYREVAKPIKGHSYVMRMKSKGKYGKIHIINIFKTRNSSITTYDFTWANLPSRVKSFSNNSSGTVTQIKKDSLNSTETTSINQIDATHTQKAELKKAYQEYIAAYNRMADLAEKGKGHSQEGQNAVQAYKKAKAHYNTLLQRKNTQQKVSNEILENSTSKQKRLYQEYIDAHNKLQALTQQGKGDTPEAQKCYKEYKRAKDRYNAFINKRK